MCEVIDCVNVIWINRVLPVSQSTVENLKAENDHLKTGSQPHLPGSGPTTSTSQPSGLSSLLGPSLRQPISMSLTKSFSLSLNDCKDPGMDQADKYRIVINILVIEAQCVWDYLTFYSFSSSLSCVFTWHAKRVFSAGWSVCTSTGAQWRSSWGKHGTPLINQRQISTAYYLSLDSLSLSLHL